jgi:integrase
MRFNITELGT